MNNEDRPVGESLDPNHGYANFAEAMETAKKIRFAMAVSQGSALSARPLTTQSVDPDGVLWFFIGAQSEFAAELSRNPEALFVYAEPEDGRYLSINGVATATRDIARARRLWTRLDATFFPGGPEDANLRVLRVEVSKIEIWEPQGTRVGQFLKLAAAAMGAQVDTRQLGHHEIVTPAGGLAVQPV